MVFNMICVTAMTSALTATGADVKMARWIISRKAWEGKPYLFTFVFLFAFPNLLRHLCLCHDFHLLDDST